MPEKLSTSTTPPPPTSPEPLKLTLPILKELMANRPHGSPAIVVLITPDVALAILRELNTRNRHLKTGAVKRYADDMFADQWRLNGDTLKFTDKLRLGDGQNRLAACVRAQTAFLTYAVFGIPDDFFYSIDQGRVRSPMDVLELAGVEHPGPVASAVRWAHLIATDKVKLRTSYTPPQTLDLFTEHYRNIEDFLDEGRAVAKVTDQPVGLVMAMLWHFTESNKDLAADFYEAWSTGTYTPRFAPIRAMQTAIAALKKKGKGRIHDVVRAAMIVNAWNLVKDDRKGAVGWDLKRPFPKVR